jgi:hypothetical protein
MHFSTPMDKTSLNTQTTLTKKILGNHNLALLQDLFVSNWIWIRSVSRSIDLRLGSGFGQDDWLMPSMMLCRWIKSLITITI